MMNTPCARLDTNTAGEGGGMPLDLDMAAAVQMRLRQIESPLSEYSFANLYLFREKHQYRLVDRPEIAAVRGRTYDGACFLMPLHDFVQGGEVVRDRLIQELDEEEWLYPVSSRWLALFPEKDFEWESRREDDDYLYPVEQMQEMPGKKLHKKRNLIKQFNRDYACGIEALGQTEPEEVIAVLDQWQEALGADPGDTDYAACREAVLQRDALGLQGLAFRVDGRVSGFLIYEDLPSGVRVVHFAKGLRGVKGLYPAMFQEAARRIGGGDGCTAESCRASSLHCPHSPAPEWINLEQDLGLPSLRKNKESYQPRRREAKYRVRPRFSP